MSLLQSGKCFFSLNCILVVNMKSVVDISTEKTGWPKLKQAALKYTKEALNEKLCTWNEEMEFK